MTGTLRPRDRRKDAAYWQTYVRQAEEGMEMLRARLAAGGRPELRVQWLVGLAGESERLAIAHYSQGQPLSVVRQDVSAALVALADSIPANAAEPFDLRGRDDYTTALWLLSMGYCLAMEPAVVRRAVDAIGNQGRDALYERLLKAIPEVEIVSAGVTKVLHPRPYGTLLRALDAPPEDRPAGIQAYLGGYYRQMRGTYWWGQHLSGDAYFGYWCFEVAAFVRAFAISDEAFASDPFYPRDLARFVPAADQDW